MTRIGGAVGSILLGLLICVPPVTAQDRGISFQLVRIDNPTPDRKTDKVWTVLDDGKITYTLASGDHLSTATYTWDSPPRSINPAGFPITLTVKAKTGKVQRMATGIEMSGDFDFVVSKDDRKPVTPSVPAYSESGKDASGQMTVYVRPRMSYPAGQVVKLQVGAFWGAKVSYLYKVQTVVAAPAPAPAPACGGGGKLAWIAGAVLLGAPPVPAAVAAPPAPRPSPSYPPPLTKGPNPLPHDLNHPQNTMPTVSGKDYVDWLKRIEALNPDKSRGQIIAAIHARSHQGIDVDRPLPGTDVRLFANGPESDGWRSVKFPTLNTPVFVTDAQGQKIDISHTIAGLRADLNRPEKVIAIGCAQFMRWANTDGGDSWQLMVQGLDRAPPDQRAGNALGIKASDFYRDPTARNILLSKFFETEFPK